jgi:hypothetical protein
MQPHKEHGFISFYMDGWSRWGDVRPSEEDQKRHASLWIKLRKAMPAPPGWKLKRQHAYITVSCRHVEYFGNLTPEWVEMFAAKLNLIK